MSFAIELSELLRRDLTRLINELAAFPDGGSLWAKQGGITNPAGNLALHLEGNLREFVGRQLGGVDYTRRREEEFSGAGLSPAEMVVRIEAVRDLVPGVVARLTESELEAVYPQQVLGAPNSTRKFLLHLYGHLSYHLGQIDYARRIVTGAGAVEHPRL